MTSSKIPPKRSVVIAARLITAIVALAGAEGVLWFGGYPPWWRMDPQWGTTQPQDECDSDLGWQARAGQYKLKWPDRADPTVVTNWSNGRRATGEQEPSSEAAKLPQVMFFGDSYIEGYQLSDSETLPWIVQRRHPEVNVSNFGEGDYGTYQCYLAIKKRVHGPAAVYHELSWFHEKRNAADPSWLRIFKPSPPGCFYPYGVLRGDAIEAHRSDGNLVWSLSRRLRSVALVQDYRDIVESYWRVRKQRQFTKTLLAKMDQAVRAEGGKFTVILFDEPQAQRVEYRDFLASQRIRFIDCDRPEMKDKSLRLPDGHPNRKMNELLAQWIDPLEVVTPPSLSARKTP